MDLFDHAAEARRAERAPLAARMRPRTLADYVGQEHVVGPGTLLRRAIDSDRLFSSIILWGPPGTGKTTLATLIAQATRAHFEIISAVMAGVADIRKTVAAAQERYKLHGQRTLVLVDEIHRFNKAQQDALLPHVENGTLLLIGATTESPYFEIVGPLLSRSRVFQLRALTPAHLATLLDRALADPQRGYGERPLVLEPDARAHLSEYAGGDARSVLNALELAVESTAPDADGVAHITLAIAQESIQRRALRYDKGADEHYDTTSAFIKSVRGSDPDAALYWLGKMVASGEDPEFIMRRLLILAAEDIGLADPHAIQVTAACAQAFQYVGLPEGQYHLSLATLYLATAPKSNSAGAYFKAREAAETGPHGVVPLHLRDTAREGKALGHGKGYRYPHAFPNHYVTQQYLPDHLVGQRFYTPTAQGYEARIAARLAALRGEDPQKTPNQAPQAP